MKGDIKTLNSYPLQFVFKNKLHAKQTENNWSITNPVNNKHIEDVYFSELKNKLAHNIQKDYYRLFVVNNTSTNSKIIKEKEHFNDVIEKHGYVESNTDAIKTQKTKMGIVTPITQEG